MLARYLRLYINSLLLFELKGYGAAFTVSDIFNLSSAIAIVLRYCSRSGESVGERSPSFFSALSVGNRQVCVHFLGRISTLSDEPSS
jgi:hypothetical protein